MPTRKPYFNCYRAILIETDTKAELPADRQIPKRTVIFLQQQSNTMFDLFRTSPDFPCIQAHNPEDVRHDLCDRLRKKHEAAGDGITVAMGEWKPADPADAEREHFTVLP